MTNIKNTQQVKVTQAYMMGLALIISEMKFTSDLMNVRFFTLVLQSNLLIPFLLGLNTFE
jgi:hypothetical protein